MKLILNYILSLLSSTLIISLVDASSLAYKRRAATTDLFLKGQELDNEAQFFRVLNEEDDFFYSFSYSYSMSYPASSSTDNTDFSGSDSNPSSVISRPVYPRASRAPTRAPSSMPTFTENDTQIISTEPPSSHPLHTQTSIPTSFIDTSGFQSDAPTTQSPEPTLKNRTNPSIRTCGLQATSQNVEQRLVTLSFQYSVELSPGTNDEFLSHLESQFLDTVASAVLNCRIQSSPNRNNRRRVLFHSAIHRHLEVNQIDSQPDDVIAGSCVPEISESNTCIIVDSGMTITVTNDDDIEQVKEQALASIISAINSGDYVGSTPGDVNILMMKYVSPHTATDTDPIEADVVIELDVAHDVANDSIDMDENLVSNINGVTGSTPKPSQSRTLYGLIGLVPLVGLFGVVLYKNNQRINSVEYDEYHDDMYDNDRMGESGLFMEQPKTVLFERNDASVDSCLTMDIPENNGTLC